MMQADDFSHAELYRRARARSRAPPARRRSSDGRRARPARERRSATRLERASSTPASRRSPTRRRPPSSAREKAKLAARDGEPRRVALVADGDRRRMHGVTHTIERIRELGVPGFEVEVIGTDRGVDRRLPAVAEVEIPFYAGPRDRRAQRCPALVETLAEGRYDLVHVASPGPAGRRRGADRPDRGHAAARQLPHRARRLRRAAHRRRALEARHAAWRSALFYGAVRAWCSRRARRPTSRCVALGIEPRRGSAAGSRGVDTSRFDPAKRDAGRLPGRDQGALRRPADQGEGRRPARRDASCARTSATRGCTCCSPAAGPRRTMLRERLGDTRRPSSAGSSGEELAARLRERRRLPLLLAAPTPTARCASRRRPAACRSSRSPRAARPR